MRRTAAAKVASLSAVMTNEPGPPDDRFGKRGFQIVGNRPTGAVPAQHGQSVDDDAGGDDDIPGCLDRRSVPVVGTVGRDVDHAPKSVDRVAFDTFLAEEQCRANGVAAHGLAWRRQQSLGEGGGTGGIINNGPIDHNIL